MTDIEKDLDEELTAQVRLHQVEAKLRSLAAYQQGDFLKSPMNENEGYDDYDERCWRERAHVDDDGHIFIPAMAFKLALVNAAKLENVKIPGKQNQTWTKQFECGVLIQDSLTLPDKVDELKGTRVFVPSNGKTGGGTRVWRRFPTIPNWSGTIRFVISSSLITPTIFERFLRVAGLQIGIGVWRIEKKGCNGSFEVLSVKWK